MGFNPPVPPSKSPYKTYYKGRFSNGPVAFEYLWYRLQQDNQGNQDNNALLIPFLAIRGLDQYNAVDFAYGGAGTGVSNLTPGGFTVPGLLGQVHLFQQALEGNKPPRKALYAVWAGANDYLLPLTSDPVVVVGNIVTAIKKLYTLGARDFIVPNLPDLGSLPIVSPPAPSLTELTKIHNALLAHSLSDLTVGLAGIKIIKVDIFALWKQLLLPSSDLITGPGPAGDCLFVNPQTCTDVRTFKAPNNFFWDVEHPTTSVHKLLSDKMFRAVQR